MGVGGVGGDDGINHKSTKLMNEKLYKYQSLVDYVDTSEEETMLIATKEEQLTANSYYTNIEIDSSLILGVMGNLIIYPENNPYPRRIFMRPKQTSRFCLSFQLSNAY